MRLPRTPHSKYLFIFEKKKPEIFSIVFNFFALFTIIQVLA